MKKTNLNIVIRGISSCLLITFLGSGMMNGQEISIDTKSGKEVSPVIYGFHYEEIGMIGDGGLHAELVRNRSFEEATPPKGIAVKNGLYEGIPNPTEGGNKAVTQIDPLIGWTAMPLSYSPIYLERTSRNLLNDKNEYSLLVNVMSDIDDYAGSAKILNEGYYGMYFKKDVPYRLSFYARSDNYNGTLQFVLTDENGDAVSSPLDFELTPSGWAKYEGELYTDKEVKRGMLAIIPTEPGRFQLDVVSLMPGDTWDNGKSIFRSDIMQNLADYAPEFIRFPGGCIVHGINVETMYQWKETIGDISERKGQWSKWGPYYRTDGLGFHEFFLLCEYLGADAMYVAPTGMVCTGFVFNKDGEFQHPEVDIDYYINEMLDAIEYAIGPVDSHWGAVRAANGHPEPFPLKYVEIGNEDFGQTYYDRYEKMYTVLKEHYPQLRVIANSRIGNTPNQLDRRNIIPEFIDPSHVEIFDEHYYRDIPWAKANFYKFDAYDRPGPDLFIGELGTSGPYPTGILADGIIKLGLERNGDLNPIMADRPLMRNWDYVGKNENRPSLLHNSFRSVKTFNFYLSKMFRDNKINISYPVEISDDLDGSIYANAGYDSESNEYIIKVINMSEESKSFELNIPGAKKRGKATVTTLTATKSQINTPDTPDQVTPVVTEIEIKIPSQQSVPGNSFTVYRIAD